MSGLIKERLFPYLEPHTRHQNMFGYLPCRSPQQALSIVFEHCSQVREKAKAQGRSLYELRAGIPRRGCVGGLQVSADFSQAFDRIGRHLLEEALAFLAVPADLSYVIMSWVHATAFHVLKDGHTESYDSVRGIRQGCKLSPTLWCCISVLLTHKLNEQLGANWCQQHGVFFADDTHMRWNIESLQELDQACAQASKALGILESNGLVLSREKTVCLLRIDGTQAPAALRKIVHKTKDGRKLQLSGEYLLPLHTTHVYLGAVDFEFQNAKHRAHAGQVTFQRLRKFLMAKRTVSFKRRLALWKSTVIPSMFYAVTASGLDRRGYDLIRIQMTKQVRAIANSPRHLTLESDNDFWRRIGIPNPLQLLRQRMQAAVERTTTLQGQLHPLDSRISPTRCAVGTTHLAGHRKPGRSKGAGSDSCLRGMWHAFRELRGPESTSRLQTQRSSQTQ